MDLPREDLSAVYLLLANLFLREADATLLAELAKPDIADVLDLLEPGVAAYIRDTDWTPEAMNDLAAEYSRLFLMPEGVSPYAAQWMQGEEGAIRARLSDQITTLYEALRVEPADFGVGNVPSDQVGMLLALTSVALQTESAPKGKGLAGRAMDLMRDWAPRFADDVRENSESPLYRAAAGLLVHILEESAPD